MRNLPLKWYVAHGAIPFLSSVKSEKQEQPGRLFLLQPAEPRKAGREQVIVGHSHSHHDLQKWLVPWVHLRLWLELFRNLEPKAFQDIITAASCRGHVGRWDVRGNWSKSGRGSLTVWTVTHVYFGLGLGSGLGFQHLSRLTGYSCFIRKSTES